MCASVLDNQVDFKAGLELGLSVHGLFRKTVRRHTNKKVNRVAYSWFILYYNLYLK